MGGSQLPPPPHTDPNSVQMTSLYLLRTPLLIESDEQHHVQICILGGPASHSLPPYGLELEGANFQVKRAQNLSSLFFFCLSALRVHTLVMGMTIGPTYKN